MNKEEGTFYVDEETNELVLTDDQNSEQRFYIEEELKLDNNKYLILIPSEEDGHTNEDQDNNEALVLKLIKDEGDDEILSVIEDDNEFEKVKEEYFSV
jgi:hypothetical protein